MSGSPTGADFADEHPGADADPADAEDLADAGNLADGESRAGDRGSLTPWLWLVGIIALCVVVPLLYHAVTTPDLSEVRAAADNAAYELDRTPVRGLGVYDFDIDRALVMGNPGGRYGSIANELKVTSKGRDSRGDLYEITNLDGDNAVCLAVKVDINLLSDQPAFPTTSVTDGHC
jgi:hypothetical protein